MFKTSVFLGLIAAASVVATVSRSHAAIDYGIWLGGVNVAYSGHSVYPNQVTLNWSDSNGHGGGGGEFRVESVYNPAGGQANITYTDSEGTTRVFKTFCLEVNEHVSLGTAYDVSVDYAAYYGANQAPDFNTNGTPDPSDDFYYDILNRSTRVLYGSYFDGTLDNKVNGINAFSYNNDGSANALQQAIWAIEDNPGSLTGLAQALYNYGIDHAFDSIGDFYFSRVGVMNLWVPSDIGSPDSPPKSAQSQLMWLIDGPSRSVDPVPEPASFAMWALGLAASAVYRCRTRRFTAKS